jgi:UDP-N-acetylglucosamine--N-acetylmuramyl-(pentapeptide) pyrophosphoryl-undecaprenol N-acetylglucosamine transferase
MESHINHTNQLNHQLRFIIAGGGTGGHIFPAVAIADALKQQS